MAYTGNLETPTHISSTAHIILYYSRRVFRGWLKAEMHRLLTHSSNINIWLEECHKFYNHLLARGYPALAIDATFRKVAWNQLVGAKSNQ